jgi:hypothetical protein
VVLAYTLSPKSEWFCPAFGHWNFGFSKNFGQTKIGIFRQGSAAFSAYMSIPAAQRVLIWAERRK